MANSESLSISRAQKIRRLMTDRTPAPYDLTLLPSVQDIRFGENEVVIWHRASGS